jgi:hypothetical protein
MQRCPLKRTPLQSKPLQSKPATLQAWQQRSRNRAIAKARLNPQPRRPLAAATPKRAAQNREYSRRRKIHLAANPFCKRCGNAATEIHHAKGRTGNLLTDARFFVALCHDCHMFVTANFNEACALGLSATRFHNEDI